MLLVCCYDNYSSLATGILIDYFPSNTVVQFQPLVPHLYQTQKIHLWHWSVATVLDCIATGILIVYFPSNTFLPGP